MRRQNPVSNHLVYQRTRVGASFLCWRSYTTTTPPLYAKHQHPPNPHPHSQKTIISDNADRLAELGVSVEQSMNEEERLMRREEQAEQDITSGRDAHLARNTHETDRFLLPPSLPLLRWLTRPKTTVTQQQQGATRNDSCDQGPSSSSPSSPLLLSAHDVLLLQHVLPLVPPCGTPVPLDVLASTASTTLASAPQSQQQASPPQMKKLLTQLINEVVRITATDHDSRLAMAASGGINNKKKKEQQNDVVHQLNEGLWKALLKTSRRAVAIARRTNTVDPESLLAFIFSSSSLSSPREAGSPHTSPPSEVSAQQQDQLVHGVRFFHTFVFPLVATLLSGGSGSVSLEVIAKLLGAEEAMKPLALQQQQPQRGSRLHSSSDLLVQLCQKFPDFVTVVADNRITAVGRKEEPQQHNMPSSRVVISSSFLQQRSFYTTQYMPVMEAVANCINPLSNTLRLETLHKVLLTSDLEDTEKNSNHERSDSCTTASDVRRVIALTPHHLHRDQSRGGDTYAVLSGARGGRDVKKNTKQKSDDSEDVDEQKRNKTPLVLQATHSATTERISNAFFTEVKRNTTSNRQHEKTIPVHWTLLHVRDLDAAVRKTILTGLFGSNSAAAQAGSSTSPLVSAEDMERVFQLFEGEALGDAATTTSAESDELNAEADEDEDDDEKGSAADDAFFENYSKPSPTPKQEAIVVDNSNFSEERVLERLQIVLRCNPVDGIEISRLASFCQWTSFKRGSIRKFILKYPELFVLKEVFLNEVDQLESDVEAARWKKQQLAQIAEKYKSDPTKALLAKMELEEDELRNGGGGGCGGSASSKKKYIEVPPEAAATVTNDESKPTLFIVYPVLNSRTITPDRRVSRADESPILAGNAKVHENDIARQEALTRQQQPLHSLSAGEVDVLTKIVVHVRDGALSAADSKEKRKRFSVEELVAPSGAKPLRIAKILRFVHDYQQQHSSAAPISQTLKQLGIVVSNTTNSSSNTNKKMVDLVDPREYSCEACPVTIQRLHWYAKVLKESGDSTVSKDRRIKIDESFCQQVFDEVVAPRLLLLFRITTTDGSTNGSNSGNEPPQPPTAVLLGHLMKLIPWSYHNHFKPKLGDFHEFLPDYIGDVNAVAPKMAKSGGGNNDDDDIVKKQRQQQEALALLRDLEMVEVGQNAFEIRRVSQRAVFAELLAGAGGGAGGGGSGSVTRSVDDVQKVLDPTTERNQNAKLQDKVRKMDDNEVAARFVPATGVHTDDVSSVAAPSMHHATSSPQAAMEFVDFLPEDEEEAFLTSVDAPTDLTELVEEGIPVMGSEQQQDTESAEAPSSSAAAMKSTTTTASSPRVTPPPPPLRGVPPPPPLKHTMRKSGVDEGEDFTKAKRVDRPRVTAPKFDKSALKPLRLTSEAEAINLLSSTITAIFEHIMPNLPPFGANVEWLERRVRWQTFRQELGPFIPFLMRLEGIFVILVPPLLLPKRKQMSKSVDGEESESGGTFMTFHVFPNTSRVTGRQLFTGFISKFLGAVPTATPTAPSATSPLRHPYTFCYDELCGALQWEYVFEARFGNLKSLLQACGGVALLEKRVGGPTDGGSPAAEGGVDVSLPDTPCDVCISDGTTPAEHFDGMFAFLEQLAGKSDKILQKPDGEKEHQLANSSSVINDVHIANKFATMFNLHVAGYIPAGSAVSIQTLLERVVVGYSEPPLSPMAASSSSTNSSTISFLRTSFSSPSETQHFTQRLERLTLHYYALSRQVHKMIQSHRHQQQQDNSSNAPQQQSLLSNQFSKLILTMDPNTKEKLVRRYIGGGANTSNNNEEEDIASPLEAVAVCNGYQHEGICRMVSVMNNNNKKNYPPHGVGVGDNVPVEVSSSGEMLLNSLTTAMFPSVPTPANEVARVLLGDERQWASLVQHATKLITKETEQPKEGVGSNAKLRLFLRGVKDVPLLFRVDDGH